MLENATRFAQIMETRMVVCVPILVEHSVGMLEVVRHLVTLEVAILSVPQQYHIIKMVVTCVMLVVLMDARIRTNLDAIRVLDIVMDLVGVLVLVVPVKYIILSTSL